MVFSLSVERTPYHGRYSCIGAWTALGTECYGTLGAESGSTRAGRLPCLHYIDERPDRNSTNRPRNFASSALQNYVLRPGEWRGGVSPPRSLRTGREPLGSSGSQYPAVAIEKPPVREEPWSGPDDTSEPLRTIHRRDARMNLRSFSSFRPAST
jgi:hypothetical protein